jgi:ribonuclease J
MTPRKPKNLRIIPLGGQEEVGRNMTVFEYGNDIVILDMGLQFPEEDMPGVDYIIPDTRYLENKKKNIRGVILSHGHLDHIGAIPHLLPKLGWPPVYASKLTLALVKKRLEEAKLNQYLKAFEIKSAREKFTFGDLKISLFNVTHSIMDALGVVIHTPAINVINMGDWRYDLDPVEGKPTDFSHLKKWNTKNIPSLLMMESLGSTKEGHQLSEKEVHKNLKEIIKKAPGRVIIATFASMVERVTQIISIAEELGKKVALDGYSMKLNIEIAKKIDPPNKIIAIVTGAQGEDRSVLMRVANNDHKHINIRKSDTIIFSSSVIPGNERSVQRLKDSLYRKGADVIHKEIMDVHGGGHALIEDIKLLIKQVSPKYIMPVYANHYLLHEAAKVAMSTGFPEKNIFILDNGNILEINQRGPKLSKDKVPIQYIFVDGLGVGDVSHVVLRDRQLMAEDGMFVIVVLVDSKTGKVRGSPDIISRGFIYLRESQPLLREVRKKTIDIVEHITRTQHPINWTYIRDNIRDKLGQFLFSKTERRPMVLPVVIEI